MKKNLKSLMAYCTFNRMCIGIFLLLYVGFYYTDYLSYISLSYIILLLGVVYNLFKYKTIKYSSFIKICILFVVYSLISSVWAYSFTHSYNASIQLFKSVFICMCFINLLNDKRDIKFSLLFLSISCLIYALLYFKHIDISMLGDRRISSMEDTDDLPNVNTVSLIVSFAFSYFIFNFFRNKNILYLFLSTIAFIFIFLLGARKTIISIFICFVLMVFKLSKKDRLILFLSSGIFLVGLVLIIPKAYLNFVLERLGELDEFLGGDNTEFVNGDDDIRISFITKGFDFFLQSPILGHGYYNFSQLFGIETGVYMYSHNNFIETLVGGGVIAFYIYYLIYYRIAKMLYGCKLKYDYGYLIIIWGVILIFNHLSIVVLQERFIWLLLALMWAATKFYKYKGL